MASLDKRLFFYKNKYPEKNDLVYCKIIDVFDCGLGVKLIEYGDIQGMVLFEENSFMNHNNLSKKYKKNTSLVCKVQNIDKEKGFIDLTKSNIRVGEKESFIKLYRYNKAIIGLFNEYLKETNDLNGINVFLEKTLYNFKEKNYFKELKKLDFNCDIFSIENKEKLSLFLKNKIQN